MRGLFRFMLREGVSQSTWRVWCARPKRPRAADVMTAEQTNNLIDGVARTNSTGRIPVRDRAMFELLYGCGVRVSELAGLNLEDLDRTEGWIRVRGKGRKERQVPYAPKAAAALERYLGERPVVRDEPAVFLNHRGAPANRSRHRAASSSSTPRCSPAIPPLHPHSFRHAYATHLLPTAQTCAPSRNCWATPAYPPPRNTRRCRWPT